VKSAELKAGKKNAIEVSTADTVYYMFADSEKEKDEWIGAIGTYYLRHYEKLLHYRVLTSCVIPRSCYCSIVGNLYEGYCCRCGQR